MFGGGEVRVGPLSLCSRVLLLPLARRPPVLAPSVQSQHCVIVTGHQF